MPSMYLNAIFSMHGLGQVHIHCMSSLGGKREVKGLQRTIGGGEKRGLGYMSEISIMILLDSAALEWFAQYVK